MYNVSRTERFEARDRLSVFLTWGLGNTSVMGICKSHFTIQLSRLCGSLVAAFHLPRTDLSGVILG